MTTLLIKAVRGEVMHEQIKFTMEECCNCHVPFMMPTRMMDALRNEPGKTFYCPNGHAQHYTGKSEAQKLKEQLEREQKERAQNEERLQNELLDAWSEKSKLEKQVKRIHKGVCPCCNRSFTNLQKHMQTKHPEIVGKKTETPIHSKINRK